LGPNIIEFDLDYRVLHGYSVLRSAMRTVEIYEEAVK